VATEREVGRCSEYSQQVQLTAVCSGTRETFHCKVDHLKPSEICNLIIHNVALIHIDN
jgi:hypothetical protein